MLSDTLHPYPDIWRGCDRFWKPTWSFDYSNFSYKDYCYVLKYIFVCSTNKPDFCLKRKKKIQVILYLITFTKAVESFSSFSQLEFDFYLLDNLRV